jgi:hypothetical protein
MADVVNILGGRPVCLCDPDGPPVASEADAVDLLGALWGQDAEWLALPTERLGPGFLVLRTGMAGAVIQKFVTYGVRLAIVGDISAELAASQALADFVRESNAGDRVWFVPNLATLEARLAPR